MNKLLVHLHIYYTAQTGYFLKQLGNINGCAWDLYVTMTKHDIITEQQILSTFPSAKIVIVENRGADVWPFIQILQSVNLEDYAYILKLHTKSPAAAEGIVNNGIRFKGFEWRDALVDALLKNKESFSRAMTKLRESGKNGIIYNVLFYRKVRNYMLEYDPLLKELARLGIVASDLHYAAGTMFLARALPYKLLQNGKINSDTFPENFTTRSYGSMTHVYEFICTIVVNASGLRTKTIARNFAEHFYIKVYVDKIEPFIEWLFSIKRIRGIKTITIFGIRFVL